VAVFACGDYIERVATDFGLSMGLDDEAVRVLEVGTDGGQPFEFVVGGGAVHYWGSYEFAVAVVSADGEAEKVTLAEALAE
jgi:hypothetical protein